MSFFVGGCVNLVICLICCDSTPLPQATVAEADLNKITSPPPPTHHHSLLYCIILFFGHSASLSPFNGSTGRIHVFNFMKVKEASILVNKHVDFFFYQVLQNLPIHFLNSWFLFLCLPGSVASYVHWQNSLPFARKSEPAFLRILLLVKLLLAHACCQSAETRWVLRAWHELKMDTLVATSFGGCCDKRLWSSSEYAASLFV